MALIQGSGFAEVGQLLGNQDLPVLKLLIVSLKSYEIFGLLREDEQPRSTASHSTGC
jgi:hypothetical protein